MNNKLEKEKKKVQWTLLSGSVMSDSMQPHGLQPARLLSPWDFSGKNTGVGCHALLPGSSRPRDQTHVSCLAGGFFTHWASGEAPILTWSPSKGSISKYHHTAGEADVGSGCLGLQHMDLGGCKFSGHCRLYEGDFSSFSWWSPEAWGQGMHIGSKTTEPVSGSALSHPKPGLLPFFMGSREGGTASTVLSGGS